MNWKDLGKQVASAAPVLGAALGGPVGGAAGALIASVFGVENTPDAVDKAIKADPESAIKLRELEQRHIERLTELENDRFRIETADVQSARGSHNHHWMPSAITICLMLMFGCAFGSLIFLSMPEGNRDMVNFMLGQLSGWLSGAVVYWVGSTRASANKDMMRK
ncbi:MAG: hypothetical protein ACRC8G_08950 [Plesiomonas shigelloides]